MERAVVTGTLLEGLAGTCAAVLTVLALLGTYPLTLTAVAVIIMGGAILFSAGGFASIAGRFRSRLRWGEVVAGGAGFEALLGAGVVAAGILILAAVVPMTLLPVAALALGVCALLASGGLQFFMAAPTGTELAAGKSASGAVEILVGLSAVVLGVLALAGMNALLFSEIAVLAAGVGVLTKCMTLSAHVAARMGAEHR